MSPKEKKQLDLFEWKLPIKLIDCSQDLPRREELGDIEELSRSLSRSGLIEPIVVRKKPEEAGRYDLICGWRRLQAAKKAGWNQISAIIKDKVSDEELLTFRLLENLKRKDLEIFETVDLLSALRVGKHPEQLAELVGWGRTKVERFLSLKKLPRDVLIQVKDGRTHSTVHDFTVAKAELLAMANLTDDSVRNLFKKITELGMTAETLRKALFRRKTIQEAAKQGIEELLRVGIETVKVERRYAPTPEPPEAVRARQDDKNARWAAMIAVKRRLRAVAEDAKKWGLDVIFREHHNRVVFILRFKEEPIIGRSPEKHSPVAVGKIKDRIVEHEGKFYLRH